MITDDQVRQAAEHWYNLIYTQWITEHFLTPTWFFQVLFVLFSYGVFFYLVDKKRIVQILLFGSLVAVSFSVYDSIGEQLGQWEYLKLILPFSPNFFLGDLTLIPLYAMLVYQYTSSWGTFLLGLIVWAGLFVFVVFNYLYSILSIFHYITPISKYLDFFLFLLDGIIARGILIILLKQEATRGNMASRASLSHLLAQPAMKPFDKEDTDKE
ncbi:hypothetical protein SRRS_13690 [Sporomusa rhizae]|uniref:hypothetical protein n=1 Tax=Sporomusa rhizae TaxID=357999 RepID=UPI00352AB4A9